MKTIHFKCLRIICSVVLVVLCVTARLALAETTSDQKKSLLKSVAGRQVTSESKRADMRDKSSAPLEESEGKADKDYVMQTGDRVKITIYPEDDHIKSAEMEISSEGNITLPLVGKVALVGKKAIESEREIAAILDRDYLVNPEVVIEVTDKYASEKEKSVVLLGQVKSPGSQSFPKAGRFTLLQAIAVAGGFSDVANIKKIKIIRGGDAQGEVLRANAEDIIGGKKPDIDLEDGDIINVAESIF